MTSAPDIGKRTTSSAIAKFSSNGLSLFIMFIRGIIFARLLDVETFGLYAFAFAWIELSSFFCNFGIEEAFLNQLSNTDDKEKLTNVHFTLQALLSFLWLGITILFSIMLTEGLSQKVFIVLAFVKAFDNLTWTPTILLQKEVNLLPLAKLDLYNIFISTIISIYLALKGYEIDVLLVIPITHTMVSLLFLYVHAPLWKPSFSWSYKIVSELLHYGFYISLLAFLQKIIKNIDKVWIHFCFGKTELGFYTTALRISQYPNSLLSSVNIVFYGAYANLQYEKVALSEMFTKIYFYLVRGTLCVVGVIICTIPEFVIFVLGKKWEPILDIVPIILITVMVSVLKQNAVILLRALGKPKEILPSKILHLILLIAFFFFANSLKYIVFTITITEIIIFIWLLWYIRRYVDYVIYVTFAVPLFAFIVSLGTIFFLPLEVASLENFIYRTVTFLFLYCFILFIREKKQYKLLFIQLKKQFRKPTNVPS